MYTHKSVKTLAVFALGLGTQACITSPYDGQRVADPADPIAVSGFLERPDTVVTIDAYNPANGTWETLGNATSESAPSLEQGLWDDSPALYHFAADVRVYDPSVPETLARWGGNSHSTELRARIGDFVFLGGRASSTSCMAEHISPTGSVAATLSLCGFRQGPVRLNYLERIAPPVLPEAVFLSPESFGFYLPLALGGTRLQISQTGSGMPLVLPGADGPVMSYLDFNETLNDRGVIDRAFDIPVENQNLGQLAMAAIGALSGGIFTAHQIRLKINNLNSTLGIDTVTVTLEDGAFALTIELLSDDPTIKCEADTLSFLPFGFPIPVGWLDETCPDAQFIDPRLLLRFVPGVDQNGNITIDDATVRLDTEIDVSPINFLEEQLHFKQRLKDGFEAQLRDKLLEPDLRSGLGTALTRLFEAERGKPIHKVLSISVDPTGVLIEVPRD
jgi:hypothetical protein